MKKQKSNKKLTTIILAAVSAIVLVVALEKLNVTNFVHTKSTSDTQTQSTELTPEQRQAEAEANAKAKQEFIESASPKTGTSTSTPQTGTPNVELSAARDNSNITVFTKLNNIGSGTCTLTTTNNGKQNTQTADVIYQPQSSICAGFSVPISELGNGTWSISLSVNSGGQTYSKVITYEVR